MLFSLFVHVQLTTNNQTVNGVPKLGIARNGDTCNGSEREIEESPFEKQNWLPYLQVSMTQSVVRMIY